MSLKTVNNSSAGISGMIPEKLGGHTDIQEVRLATQNRVSGFYIHELAVTERALQI